MNEFGTSKELLDEHAKEKESNGTAITTGEDNSIPGDESPPLDVLHPEKPTEDKKKDWSVLFRNMFYSTFSSSNDYHKHK